MTYKQYHPPGGVEKLQGIFWLGGKRYLTGNNPAVASGEATTSVYDGETGAYAARIFARNPSDERPEVILSHVQYANSAVIVSDRAGNRRTHLIAPDGSGGLAITVTGALTVPAGYDFSATPPVAAATDGTTTWYFTTTDIFTAAPGAGGVTDYTLTHVTAHGLSDLKAAAYWDGKLVAADAQGRIWALDTTTYVASLDPQDAPLNLRSLNTDPDGNLWGVTSNLIAEFDPEPTERPAEDETVEWRFRERKTHNIVEVFGSDNDVVREFSCDWRWQEAGQGELLLSADTLPRELALGLLGWSAEYDGGLEVEFWRRHRFGTNQFVGIVDKINLERTGTPDVTIVSVGGSLNFVTVLGARTAGTGGAECRVPAEARDPNSIDLTGLHEMPPISHNVATDRGTLEAIGRARLKEQSRRDVLDSVEFTRSPRIDQLRVYLTDPIGYLARRYSTPGENEALSYGGRNAAEYVDNLLRTELEVHDSSRSRYNKTLGGGDGVLWARGGNEGSDAGFNVPYPRTQLSRICTDAMLAGEIGWRYWIDLNDNVLYIGTERQRDRTADTDDPVLQVDSGEGYDPDLVDQGDLITRQLILADRSLGPPFAHLQVWKRVKYEQGKGVRIKYGGGDVPQYGLTAADVINLTNDVRVT